MTRAEAIKQLSEELRDMIINVLDVNLRSCINCFLFDKDKEVCTKWKARPPAKVIAKGCPDWKYDEDIPF